jgi:hypothetical protein
MPPVGLLAIAALGLVLVYALPQRLRERADYAMVRTEDRFSADMRVIRASVARMEARPASPASAASPTSAASPGRRAGSPAATKKTISALGESVMTRPAAPLDRAATRARREMVAMRRDRAKVLARRRAQSHRRGAIATLALLGSGGLWGFVVVASAPAWAAWVAVGTSTLFGSSVVAGRRASRAYAEQDEKLIPVATEVMVAATAAAAIQRVSTERAVGHRAVPTASETQAIRTLLSENPLSERPLAKDLRASGMRPGNLVSRNLVSRRLVPGASPAQLPGPELPGFAEPAVDDPSWTPNTMPVPSYTLQPSAKPGTARPISEEDLAAGARAAEEAVDRRIAEREADERRRVPAGSASGAGRSTAAQSTGRDADPQPATATLDAILARRRRQSA